MVGVLVLALVAAAGLVAAAAAQEGRADLSATVAGDARTVAGQAAAFRVSVRNSGPGQAENARVEIRVSGVRVDGYDAPGCAVAGPVATCELGKVKKQDAARHVDVRIRPGTSGSLELDVAVRSPTADPNESNNRMWLTSEVVAGPTPPAPPAPPTPPATPPAPPSNPPAPPSTPGPQAPAPTTPGEPGPGSGTQDPPGSGPSTGQPGAGSGAGQDEDPLTPGPGSVFPDVPAAPAPDGEVRGEQATSMLVPFPVVRIAGRLTRTGARLTRLTVTTPPSVRILFGCRGRTCPGRSRRVSVAASARKRIVTVRLRNAERAYRAGTRLEVAVQRRGRMGKFTSFTIRRGKPPTRADACIGFRARRSRPCPGA